MSVTVMLRPMSQTEYDAFVAASIADYAAEHVAAGDWAPEGSLERSRAEFDVLLPDGLSSAGQHLYTALDAVDEQPVGILWLGLRPRGEEPMMWIWDVAVHESRRGRGYGRALLAAAEDAASGLGAHSIGLNVFGPNRVARRLYESSGFEITSQQMRKPLG